MKLHVNMPDVGQGDELEVMNVGLVKNGSTVELTEVQVQAMRASGVDLPQDGGATVKLYNPPPAKSDAVLKTTNLPGIEEVAEKERAKTARKSETKEGGK